MKKNDSKETDTDDTPAYTNDPTEAVNQYKSMKIDITDLGLSNRHLIGSYSQS